MQEIRGNNAIHKLGYHLVFCTKYRRRILVGAIEVATKKILTEVCKNNGFILHTIEVMPDHVHLFIQLEHTTAPIQAVKLLKACSAIYIFEKFKDVKNRKFWGSGLWSNGCYYASVGNCTEKAVRKYIEQQRKDSNSSQG